MTTVLYDKDADLGLLSGKTVAVLGYGSQGHAHAQNLRDSGVSVVVGLQEGSKSKARAEKDGFDVFSVREAVSRADVVIFLMPDHIQAQVYRESVAPVLKKGAALAFAHGFCIHFHQVVPCRENDVFMVAPKGPGHLVRRMYVEGRGVPCLLAVHQNASGKARELGLAYASAIGGVRAGVIETTFAEETETDLFGEQAVLCGGVCELIHAGFDTLVEAGYAPEMAYFETCHEMKLIVDLINEGGISKQRWSCSDTAEYGDYVSGPRVITPDVKEHMKEVLGDIQSGAFAKRFMDDQAAGGPEFARLRAEGESHPIETTGREVRSLFAWRADVDADYTEGSVAR